MLVTAVKFFGAEQSPNGSIGSMYSLSQASRPGVDCHLDARGPNNMPTFALRALGPCEAVNGSLPKGAKRWVGNHLYCVLRDRIGRLKVSTCPG